MSPLNEPRSLNPHLTPYQLVALGKKYKQTSKDEGGERSTLEVLRGQNQELKAVLTKMEEEFPYLRHNLKKVKALLPPSTA